MDRNPESHDQPGIGEDLGEQLLKIVQDAYGKGAARARVVADGDDIIVFLDDLELQRSEEFLIESGHPDWVIDQRHHFQQAIESTFNAAVERMTGRRVISFASITKLDPHYAIEIFRLAPEVADSDELA